MYGLPQSGMLANNHITKHLLTYGYNPIAHTPGLWWNQMLPTYFNLVVDNFRFKYVGQKYTKHLVASIVAFYPLTTDW